MNREKKPRNGNSTGADEPDVQLSRIHAAVSREEARRSRRIKIYISLLAIPIVLMIAVFIFGRSDAERTKELVAQALPGDAGFVSDVSRSPEMRAAIETVADNATAAWIETNPETIANLVTGSESFQSRTGEVVQDAMVQPEVLVALGEQISSSDALMSFRRETVEQARDSSNRRVDEAFELVERSHKEIDDRVSTNAFALEALDERVTEVDKSVRQAISALEGPAGGGIHPGDDRRFDTLTKRIDLLETRIQQLSKLPSHSKGAVPDAPRSLLVKERTTTPIHGLDLTLTVGRKVEGGVTHFELRSRNELVLEEGSQDRPVRFGQPFSFTTPNHNRYEITLGYALNRHLAKDYIGVEIVEIE